MTAATALPLVLFSLVAGAAADVRGRRRVTLTAQTVMLLVSAGLSAITYIGHVTPLLPLAFTFLLGCGWALYVPASQSSIGDQLPREDLAGACPSTASASISRARSAPPSAGGS